MKNAKSTLKHLVGERSERKKYSSHLPFSSYIPIGNNASEFAKMCNKRKTKQTPHFWALQNCKKENAIGYSYIKTKSYKRKKTNDFIPSIGNHGHNVGKPYTFSNFVST